MARGADGSAADSFFGLTNLWEVRLEIAADEWARIEPFKPDRRPGGPPQPGQEGPGGALNRGPGGPPPIGPRRVEFPVVKGSIRIGAETVADVGLRFKGNSSFNFARSSLKKSFKIDFDKYTKGKTFAGLSKLNLNNNAMDATAVRESVAYEIFRRAGIPAPRTAFAKVFLTVAGQYQERFLGVYTVVEQVDKAFVKRHLTDGDVLLVKPERMRGIPYLGEDWETYSNRFDVKSKGSKAQRQRFIDFARWLKEADTDAFARGFEERADVRGLLRLVALNGMIANLDSLLGSGHNYYLTMHPTTGKVIWLPWDLNEAFGRFRMGASVREMIDLSVAHPYAGNDPLLDRLFEVEKFRSIYQEECRALLKIAFERDSVTALLETAARKIAQPAAEEFKISAERYLANAIGSEAIPAQAADGSGAIERRPPGFRGPPPRDFEGLRGDQEGLSLVQWTRLRNDSIQRQLAGESEGVVPRGMRGPMGPGPGPGFRPGPRP